VSLEAFQPPLRQMFTRQVSSVLAKFSQYWFGATLFQIKIRGIVR
jgi:hypothetical protein